MVLHECIGIEHLFMMCQVLAWLDEVTEEHLLLLFSFVQVATVLSNRLMKQQQRYISHGTFSTYSSQLQSLSAGASAAVTGCFCSELEHETAACTPAG